MADWAGVREKKGTGALLVLGRICPHWLLCLIAVPVSWVYWACAPAARRSARGYLDRLGIHASTWKCFYAFSLTLIEKLEGWAGRFGVRNLETGEDDAGQVRSRLRSRRGVLFFVSHLGNVELMRGLAAEGRTGLDLEVPVLSFVYFQGTASFNRVVAKINPDSMLHLVDASKVDAEAMDEVQKVLDAGGIVVIAGDRTPVHGGRTLSVPFLGEEARFPLGAFYLATLVDVPSYSVSFVRTGDLSWRRKWEMRLYRNPDPDRSSRKTRMQGAKTICEAFVRHLEEGCRRHPYQWGNFYDFWGKQP